MYMYKVRGVLIIIIIINYLLQHQCVAQVSINTLPIGLDAKVYDAIFETQMPSLNPAPSINQTDVKDPRVAYNFKTAFTPYNSGTWKTYSEKNRTWHIKLKSPGAHGIALVLSKVKLNPGEKLFIFNHSGIAGSYTDKDVPPSEILPHDFLRGDEIVVEFTVTNEAEKGNFQIETVSHAYVDLFSTQASLLPNDAARTNAGSDCYICIEDEELNKNKRAVVKMIVHFEDATLVCTGSLINNTTRDKKPLIVTAQHCIDGDYTANRTVFIFNYENASCDESVAMETHKLNGASYLTSSFENDFSLVELNYFPPVGFRPYYAGWNLSEKPQGAVMSIHHPRGGPKQVSFSRETVTSSNFGKEVSRARNGFWKVKKWDSGITEGGSSGAPLFNDKYQIIGTLTGGSAECDYPYNDYFEKLSSTWKALPEFKYWLDPLSLNVTSIEGMDPFEGINPICDSISNIKSFEFAGLQPYTSGGGYFSGYNSGNITSYAEKFFVADSTMLTGSLFSVGSVNTNAVGGLIVTVNAVDGNGLPGVALYETYIPYYKLSEASNYIEIYPYVKIKGNFFIAYTISGLSDDQFALNQAAWRNASSNTAYVKLQSGWKPITHISPNNRGSSFAIDAILCEHLPVNPAKEELTLQLYPNPATDVIVCKLLFTLPREFELRIYDLQGKSQAVSFQQMDNNLVIYTSGLNSGMYIMRLVTGNKVYNSKFIKGAFNK